MNNKFKELIIPFLYLVFAVHLYAIYQGWQEYTKKDQVAQQPSVTTNATNAVGTDRPQSPKSRQSSIPVELSTPSQATPSQATPSQALDQAQVLEAHEPKKDVPTLRSDVSVLPQTTPNGSDGTNNGQSQLINVKNELYTATLSTAGGDIESFALNQYPDRNGVPYQLLNKNKETFLSLSTGIVSDDNTLVTPEINAEYRLTQLTLRAEGESTATYEWSFGGLILQKNYRFMSDSHTIGYTLSVYNNMPDRDRIKIFPFVQQTAAPRKPTFLSSSFIGATSYGKEQGYEKIKYNKILKGGYTTKEIDTWFAFVNHYYISAFIPEPDTEMSYYSNASEIYPQNVILGGNMPGAVISNGSNHSWNANIYLGPKKAGQLKEVHRELAETIDYGVLAFLSRPMFWLMNFFYGLIGNWGWAIIFLTIVIRLVLYYPAAIAFKSMSKIKKVHPEMLLLREKYAEDKQRLGMEMMNLYKEHKINPLSGCLPILLQIPVFIALFWMLSESVELKYAPWILWFEDLSTPDPYFVLPLLMALSMMVQQNLTAQPTDPIQKKVFALLPVLFGGMSIFFPSGLVLYWFVNNILAIFQQVLIEIRLKAQEDTQ